jgi:excisionase family DNA binding protein
MERTMEPQEELLTVEEFADRLSVHEQTVRRWLRNGQINGTMLNRRAGYRIRASEVDRVMRDGLMPSKELAAV